MNAVAYMGFSDQKCVFIGFVGFHPVRKVLNAVFGFDNKYVRDEFQAIVEKENDRTRANTSE